MQSFLGELQDGETVYMLQYVQVDQQMVQRASTRGIASVQAANETVQIPNWIQQFILNHKARCR